MLKRKIKIATALTASIMILGSFSACSRDKGNDNEQPSSANVSNLSTSGFPIVKDQITIKMFACKGAMHAPWADMAVWQEYEKKTNIKVEFETAPEQGFTEKKNLLFASSELPDAFIRSFLSTDEMTKYGQNGALIPLEGLIDKYAPNLKKLLTQYPEAEKSLLSPDGHIYALPGVVTLNAARTPKYWIKKSWLEKTNNKIPTTIDELTDVLKAFRDTDLNGNGKKDEIPMSNGNIGDLINILAGSWGMGVQMGFNVNIVDSKVKIWFTDDRFKEELTFLNKLYKEKLIDQEIFTQDYAKYLSKVNSQSVGMFFIQTDDSFDSKDYQGIAPFKGPKGDQLVGSAGPIARDMGTFAITRNNKNPEATMKWIDYFYSEEGSAFLRYGIEGKTNIKKADGSIEYTDEILNDKRGKGTAIGQFTIWPGGGAPHWINEKNSTAINSKATQEAQKALEPYLPKAVYGAPLFDEATRDRALPLKADITKYYNETIAKFILGDMSLDKWPEYIATMQKLGIKDLEAIYQKAYDNMNKK
ncbi:MAG: extracellular solute-binding protein [Clostridiales bacterium]|nr:extracellular solute-binding protein [Clostridiales bacterium]